MDKNQLHKGASLQIKAHAAVLLAGCMWGSVGIFVRPLSEHGYNPLTIVFVRMSIAFLILLPFLWISNRELLRIKAKDIWVFIGTGLTSAIALNLFYSMSIIMNSLALAAVLLATAPVIVVFMSAPLFKERITAVKLTALALTFAGCVFTSGLIGSGGQGFNPMGVFIGLLAGVGYALYSIFSRVALNKGYDSLTINIYSFGIGAIACIPFTDFAVVASTVQFEPLYMCILLLAHSMFTSLLPYVLYTYSLKFIETGKAAILSSVEPVAAAILGVIIYTEIPSMITLAGMALVLAAVVLLNLKLKRR